MPRRNAGPRLRFLEKRQLYYIVWTESGRSRERSTGTADRGEAQVALAEFLRLLNQGAGPRDPSEVLVTDALADYAEEHASATAAPWRVGLAIRSLAGFWQGRSIANVTRETCRGYERTRKRAPGTIRRELGVLRAAINHAHREGRITRPVPVHLPDRPESRDRWLTRSEAARLLAASLGFKLVQCCETRGRNERWAVWGRSPDYARLHLPLFILIGLYTGQRKEAILSLRWSQVDLEAGLINFNPPGRKQTNKRRPRVPIAPRLLPHLKRARLRGTDVGFVVHRGGKRIGDVKTGFKAACVRGGLKAVSPHTLRHTCATWMMQRGVPKWEAAGFLGMTMETLEQVYGHHHPDYLRGAARAFS